MTWVSITSGEKCMKRSVRCKRGQRWWWIRSRHSGAFHKFPEGTRYHGTKPIKATVDLSPGEYILGCGPDAEKGVRIPLKVVQS